MTNKISPIRSVLRASEVLRAFRDGSECLRLSDIVKRTGLNKTTAFRLIATLVRAELLAEIGGHAYKLRVRLAERPKYSIGYALQSSEFAFSRAVASSLQRSAAAADIDLLLLDNQDNPKTALKNAAVFIREKIDLVIESQTDVRIAGQISERFRQAKIPMIAVEIPLPGAIYFGANNTQAGLIAGRHLARWTESQWGGVVDELLLLELPKAGQLPNARVLGSLLGVLERYAGLTPRQIKVLKTNGHEEAAYEKVRNYLKGTSAEHILVSAINDPCAMGALLAFREAGREEHCAVAGQNASEEVHMELQNRKTRLIGSVGYFPERYGEGVIPLALDVLSGRSVPPATFVKHQIVTPANFKSFYPEAIKPGQTMQKQSRKVAI
ncbi:substrate-binding domain-containing protein [Alloacidobacterium sp.]|uniref:substrate-binding domain-containing protein n=1 Tax=Alloacidobacterium sp. TaxID=2951999 RepID=UPI002D24197B|nr:substrate-binding domain-containing protein [Alloacidobacterium sp.]HYK34663.1 substrate-binding domain-containing protein [Alloacidobacterium sp.]